jgi:hypothetical protein
LADKPREIEVAKEVFENMTDYGKVIYNMVNQNETLRSKESKSVFYQNSTVMNNIKSIPCYQEVLLQTERHVMGDTGPLPLYLWIKIAEMV